MIRSQKEAAEQLGVSTRTLQRWYRDGTGPKVTRLGERRIGYLDAELEAWANRNTFASRAAELAQKIAA